RPADRDRQLPHAPRTRRPGAAPGGRAMSHPDLEARLRELHAPGEDAAAERAWAQVSETLDVREVASPEPLRSGRTGASGPRPLPRGARRSYARVLSPPALGLAALVLAVVVAAALTPPGEAVADWLRNAVVRPAPRHPSPAARPIQLPAGGALLARTAA